MPCEGKNPTRARPVSAQCGYLMSGSTGAKSKKMQKEASRLEKSEPQRNEEGVKKRKTYQCVESSPAQGEKSIFHSG